MWVGGGQPNYNSSVLYSSDGINWKGSSSGSSYLDTAFFTAEWNGQFWLAGGRGSTYQMIKSYDGVTWTPVTSANSFTQISSLLWNGSYWLATSLYAPTYRVHYSYDGSEWYNATQAYSIIDGSWWGIAWNGTYYVGVGSKTSSSYTIAYSTDGITWTGSSSGTAIINDFGTSVAWNGTMFVVGGGSYGGAGTSCLMYSYDGINWTASANGASLFGSNAVIYGLSWNGTLWIAGGQADTNRVATSTDGITWTLNTSANALTGQGGSYQAINTISSRRLQTIAGQIPVSDRQQGRVEVSPVSSISTTTFTANFLTTGTFYISSVNQNFTVNITNVPKIYGSTFTVRLIIAQGSSGYYPNGLQIDGASQSLRWLNNTTPTPGTNKTDLVTLICNLTGGWTILGEMKSYA
jgi:hypothetical protein